MKVEEGCFSGEVGMGPSKFTMAVHVFLKVLILGVGVRVVIVPKVEAIVDEATVVEYVFFIFR